MLNDDEVQRALVICAHPDDVDFGAAGTVATWTEAGVDIAYCIVTDGDAGGFDPSVPRAEIPGIRRTEQTAAAKAVGVSDLTFLGYPDGRLVTSLDLRRDLAREIRRVRPQRVVCPSPERNWQRIFASHPDHLAAGEAALAAVYPDARNPFAHPELLVDGYEPWTVLEVWMMAAPVRNRWVDITDVLPRKLDALCNHVSQHTDADGKLEARLRGWGALVAQEAALADGRLAEGFFAIDSAGVR
jgi:LmbE family N-acetylglucosaminyl deacetylase